MLEHSNKWLPNRSAFLQPLLVFCVALLLAIVHGGIGGLQNDDLQISFMLSCGGEEPSCFSLYTNACLGYVIRSLSSVWPDINWYYCFLCALSCAASLTINFSVCERTFRSGIVSKTSVFLFLAYINYRGLITIQYTYLGVYAACAAVLLVSRIIDHCFSVGRIGVSTLLLFAAYCLRSSVVLPATFLLIGILLAEWESMRDGRTLRRLATALVIPLFLCGCAFVANKIEYQNSPEWNDAQRFLQARVQIVDSQDNSGMDKETALHHAGISPESFFLFKKFLYVPEMDSLNAVESALTIHKTGRKGFLGSAALADMGLLEFHISSFKPLTTLARALTPYTPLGFAVLLVLLFPGRKRMLKAAAVLFAVAGYLFVLSLTCRLPGRVLDPVLYASAMYVMSLPEKSSLVRNRVWRISSAIFVSAMACLFCFRHLMEQDAQNKSAWAYCESKPDTLFFSCSMQWAWTTSSKVGAFSLHHLKHSNILPLADGWVFYTPAYRAALKARGVSCPYIRLTQPNAEIIVNRRYCSPTVLLDLQKMIFAQTGQRISFIKAAEKGDFEFYAINDATSHK